MPIICWNHRWEHDKDPESFFEAMYSLEDMGYDFRIIVLGQSFIKSPSCFTEAQERLSEKIIHFGFIESKKEYLLLLQRSDIVISTANHEFFGISIIEAIRCGCIPLVPDRLSYPELYPEQYRYGEGELVSSLAQMLDTLGKNDVIRCTIDTERFSWRELKRYYYKWLLGGAL